MFFVLMVASVTWAQTVLIQAPSANTLDYRAALKAHPAEQSPSQNYRAKHPLMSEREQLINALAEAQRAFLGDSPLEAQRKWLGVLDLLWSDDWDRTDREIFVQAYLRLAQTESSPAARDRWLNLSLLLGDDVRIDTSLFPPPLLQRRTELLREAPIRTISSHSIPAGWAEILVNGRPCARDGCSWPSHGKARVTLLSEQWLPHTEVIDINELDHLKPRLTPYVSGRCGQDRFHEEAEKFPARKVFWSLDCDSPDSTPRTHSSVAGSPVPSTPLIFEPNPPAKKFYQTGWFWAGVTAVAIVAVIAISNSQKKETHDTTTTYGY